MRKFKKIEAALLLCTVAQLSACGGGGGGSGDPAATPSGGGDAQQMVANGDFTGHMLVDEGAVPSTFITLSTGQSQVLPSTEKTSTSLPEDDEWVPSADGQALLRWNESPYLSYTRIWMFDAATMKQTGYVELEGQGGRPMLSPDRKYILGRLRNSDGDRILTVFDSRTGKVVKSGSRLDLDAHATISDFNQVAWLGNGLYVYMVANKLARGNPATPASQDEYIATLDLPFNSLTGTDYDSGQTALAVSPDGGRVAFTWSEKRKGVLDNHIWILEMSMNGVKSLKRITSAPDPESPLRFPFAEPSWSPDGKYLSFVLHMSGTTSALVFPDAPFAGGRVTGTTGCGTSIAYTLPSSASNVALSWPSVDPSHAIKVRSSTGVGGSWLTSCGTVFWMP